jgi:carboxyl-terminal processing protease
MKKTLFIFFFLILAVQIKIFTIQLPELTAHDTKIKIDKLIRSHANYYKLYNSRAKQKELIKRTLNRYLHEIDPTASYFISSEIDEWINPSDTLLENILKSHAEEKFPAFEEIFSVMQKAIIRRRVLEDKNSTKTFISNDDFSEYHNTTWADSIDALENKILKTKSIETKTAQTLCNDETRELFLERLKKQRLKKEKTFIHAPPTEQERLNFSLILKAISTALDPHTFYFTPHEANQFKIQLEQKLFGIGVQIRDDINGFTIVEIYKNSPASKISDIQIGDKIVAIDRKPVIGLDIFEIVELIRGAKNTPVTLTLLKTDNQIHDTTINRDEIVLETRQVESSREPFGNGIIGILKLALFYENQNKSSYSELKDALVKLKQENTLKGVILDMRNNAGGLLSEAMAISSLFIKEKAAVFVKDNTGSVTRVQTIDSPPFWNGPLIVLINRASASAAEIVTQTLKEYGRAIVTGDPSTYGKGTFQISSLKSGNYENINPEGEITVTRGWYYTFSGNSPQLIGVFPNIVIPGVLSELEIGEKFLQYPLESDSITPNFNNNLNEHPTTNQNEVLNNNYKTFLQHLQKNSQMRLEQNKKYQNFLKLVKKKTIPTSFYEQKDLQLYETINVMKDLLVLSQNPLTDTSTSLLKSSSK